MNNFIIAEAQKMNVPLNRAYQSPSRKIIQSTSLLSSNDRNIRLFLAADNSGCDPTWLNAGSYCGSCDVCVGLQN